MDYYIYLTTFFGILLVVGAVFCVLNARRRRRNAINNNVDFTDNRHHIMIIRVPF